MAYDEHLAGRIRAVLADRPDVEEKKMFGGISFMVAGQMCCGVLKNDLVARVGGEGIDHALAQPGARPFDFSGRPMTGMVYIAAEGVRTEQALAGWVKRAVEAVNLHPRAAKRTGRKRQASPPSRS